MDQRKKQDDHYLKTGHYEDRPQRGIDRGGNDGLSMRGNDGMMMTGSGNRRAIPISSLDSDDGMMMTGTGNRRAIPISSMASSDGMMMKGNMDDHDQGSISSGNRRAIPKSSMDSNDGMMMGGNNKMGSMNSEWKSMNNEGSMSSGGHMNSGWMSMNGGNMKHGGSDYSDIDGESSSKASTKSGAKASTKASDSGHVGGAKIQDDDPAKKGKSNNAKLPSKRGKGKYKNKFYLVSLKEKQTGSKKGATST